MKQEMMGWQTVASTGPYANHFCTSLQTDNHASTSLFNFSTDRLLFLTLNPQCRSTEGVLEEIVVVNISEAVLWCLLHFA